MATNTLDLGNLFAAVAKNLSANQEALNQADSYNHDHGNNIVNIFQTAAQAAKAKKGATPAEQLAHASARVKATQPSGSGQFYADSLAAAASQVKGKKQLDSNSAMSLITALLGSGQQAQTTPSQSGAGDLLGSLLGGSQQPAAQDPAADLLGSLLGGGQQGSSQAPGADLLGALLGGQQGSSQSQGGDMLGALLGGLTGQQSSQSDGKLDINDLITAGMSFMQSKQRGASTIQALVGAILAASPLGQSQARSMSGNIIASTLLKKMQSGLAASNR